MRNAFLAGIFLFCFSRSVQAQDTTCSGAPALDLAVGDVVVVNPGEAQNIRQQATVEAEKLVAVPPGEYLTVWGGSVCGDSYRWWQVEYDRQVGWTAEGAADGSQYWLSKIETQIYEQGNVRFEISTTLASGLSYVDERASGGDGFDVPPNRKFSLEGYPVVSTWGREDWYAVGIDTSGGIMLAPRTQRVNRDLYLETLGTELNANRPDEGSLGKHIAPTGRYDYPHLAYLRLNGVTAKRLLAYKNPTQFNPEGYQPIQPRLIYYFEGLTEDGKYYIRAFFPIEVEVELPPFPEIPRLSSEEDRRLFTEYAIAVNRTFDQLPPTAFTPRLALLDAMLRSIRVTGEIELQIGDGS